MRGLGGTHDGLARRVRRPERRNVRLGAEEGLDDGEVAPVRREGEPVGRPKTEFRFQNTALSLARFDGVGRPIQNAALSLARFSQPNSDICELRSLLSRHLRVVRRLFETKKKS